MEDRGITKRIKPTDDKAKNDNKRNEIKDGIKKCSSVSERFKLGRLENKSNSINPTEIEREKKLSSFAEKKKAAEERQSENKKNINNLKTGVGTSGEGLLLKDIPDKVLNDILPDSSAFFGHLPKEGTRYDSKDYDFKDKDFCRRNKVIREEYPKGSETLRKDIEIMRSEGKSSKEIGEYCVNTRNRQKVESRRHTLPEEVKKIEDGNIRIYINPVGPSPEQQFRHIKDKLIKSGEYESNEQVWQAVIEGSLRKDKVINTLLGIKH